jgi:hypothetical protein
MFQRVLQVVPTDVTAHSNYAYLLGAGVAFVWSGFGVAADGGIETIKHDFAAAERHYQAVRSPFVSSFLSYTR